jgi:hypothetical protein
VGNLRLLTETIWSFMSAKAGKKGLLDWKSGACSQENHASTPY